MKISAQNIFTAFKWLILVSAYAFLAYKLVVFDGYADLAAHFAQTGAAQYLFLLIVFLLLPLNLALEAAKWRCLLSGLQPVSFRFALKSVLVGQTGAFFTPNRLGDFPTRALLLRSENVLPAVALGCVGSAAQTAAITLFGAVAAAFYVVLAQPDFVLSASRVSLWLFVAVVAAVVVFAAISLACYGRFAARLQRCSNRWAHLLGDGLAHLSLRNVWAVFALSAARFAVFSTQLYAMLLFMDVAIVPLEALVAIPTVYLLVTYTPSFAFSEAVVRGSYAILVLSAFSSNEAGMAFASVLLWAVNYCLPMLVGSFLFRRNKA